MIYRVTTFNRGVISGRADVESKSFRRALLNAPIWQVWQTATVVNAKGNARRYMKTRRGGLKLNRANLKFFKTFHRACPSILVMAGTCSEVYKFGSEEEREKKWQQISMTCDPVESASEDKESSDTIASSAAMSGSRNFLTLTKTLNGFAERVTWMDLPTRSSTDKSFGEDSVENTDGGTWSDGWEASRSAPKPIFATVKPARYLPDGLKILAGITWKFEKTPNGWKGLGYAWRDEWLDFNKATLYVKDNAPSNFYEGMIGRTLYFRKCGDHWNCVSKARCIATEHLALPPKQFVSGVLVGGTPALAITEKQVRKHLGKTFYFQLTLSGNLWARKIGLFIHPSWVKPLPNLDWKPIMLNQTAIAKNIVYTGGA